MTINLKPLPTVVVPRFRHTSWTPSGDLQLGRVAKVLRVGSWVYVAGNFNRVEDEAVDSTEYSTMPYLCRYDATTGALDTTWTPNPDARVRDLCLSDDGTLIIVGGEFGTIFGVSRDCIAAFNVSTGLVATNFTSFAVNTALTGGDPVGVRSIVTRPGTSEIVVGGNFTSIGGVSRSGVAKVSSVSQGNTAAVVSGWTPSFSSQVVRVAYDVTNARVIVGQESQGLIAGGNTANKVAAINISTGASVWQSNPRGNVIMRDLSVSPTRCYVAVAGSGGETHQLDLATGTNLGFYHSDGDNQAVHYFGGYVFVGHHGQFVALTANNQTATAANGQNSYGVYVIDENLNLQVDWRPNFIQGDSANFGVHKLWAINSHQPSGQMYFSGDFGGIKPLQLSGNVSSTGALLYYRHSQFEPLTGGGGGGGGGGTGQRVRIGFEMAGESLPGGASSYDHLFVRTPGYALPYYEAYVRQTGSALLNDYKSPISRGFYGQFNAGWNPSTDQADWADDLANGRDIFFSAKSTGGGFNWAQVGSGAMDSQITARGNDLLNNIWNQPNPPNMVAFSFHHEPNNGSDISTAISGSTDLAQSVTNWWAAMQRIVTIWTNMGIPVWQGTQDGVTTVPGMCYCGPIIAGGTNVNTPTVYDDWYRTPATNPWAWGPNGIQMMAADIYPGGASGNSVWRALEELWGAAEAPEDGIVVKGTALKATQNAAGRVLLITLWEWAVDEYDKLWPNSSTRMFTSTSSYWNSLSITPSFPNSVDHLRDWLTANPDVFYAIVFWDDNADLTSGRGPHMIDLGTPNGPGGVAATQAATWAAWLRLLESDIVRGVGTEEPPPTPGYVPGVIPASFRVRQGD